jgi:hypothetical protein
MLKSQQLVYEPKHMRVLLVTGRKAGIGFWALGGNAG